MHRLKLSIGCCLAALAAFSPEQAGAASSTVYVADSVNGVLIYKGSKVSRIVPGSKTHLYSPISIARQASGDLVVVNRESHDGKPGSIVTLPPKHGKPAPKYIIRCREFGPWGIAIDAASIIWMTTYETNQVRAYAATANGCTAPRVTISGTETKLNLPEDVAIDSAGRIVVANYLSGILIFAPGASGDATPTAQIADSHTVNAHLEGMTIDSADNIWVTSYANSEVVEYPAGATSGASPLRVIKGTQTGVANPIGIAVDPNTGEIYVCDIGAKATLVFAADAKGNAAPIRKLDAGGFPTGVTVR